VNETLLSGDRGHQSGVACPATPTCRGCAWRCRTGRRNCALCKTSSAAGMLSYGGGFRDHMNHSGAPNMQVKSERNRMRRWDSGGAETGRRMGLGEDR
jgi:hypothetical protein